MPPVPHLKTKLQILYKSGRNPAITNQQSLAAELGISTAQISNWLNGGGGMKPESIPENHVDKFCQLFTLNIEDLAKDLEYFRKRVTKPYSGWKRLFDRAVPYDDQNRIGLALKHRGLAYQPGDDEVKGERYEIGDEFRMEISGPPGWHIIVLVRDPVGVTCWCPSEYFLDNTLTSTGIAAIPDEQKPAITITQPVGQHWLLTIYTENRLPDLLYQQLYDALPMNRELAIDRLEQALNNKDVGQWLALRKAFHVVDS